MAGTVGFVAIATASAFACASLGVAAASGFSAAGASASRVQRTAGAGSFAERTLRNGIPALLPFAERVLTIRFVATWCRQISRAADAAGLTAEPRACASLGLAWIAACVFSGVLCGSALVGMACGLLGLIAVRALALRALDMRSEAMRDSLPDALRMMSACFHAGFTLQQTFEQVAQEARGPLAEVFARAARQMDTGSSAREALDSVRSASDVPELAFLSVALEVQHRAGGSMQHVLDATRESLEGELELRRSLRVHTAQARLSAHVVVGVTVALIAVLSLLSHDFLAPFFSSPVGLCMLVVAVAMQVAGIVAVHRLLDVEVD